MSTNLKISGTEAIDLMKQTYPKSWQDKIQEKAAMLLRFKKQWNQDSLEKTYLKYMNYVGETASSIEMLAALQTLKNEQEPIKSIHDQIKEIIAMQDQILMQQEALEKGERINEFDKKTLRGYYKTKQDELSKRLKELTISIEVVEPCVLIIQGNLFNQSKL
jgi:hypothetical protein